MIVCGLDEVGRGSFAGPIVACGVILKEKHNLTGLKDSKKLSGKQRETLAKNILENSLWCGVAWASVEEINNFGLGWANKEIFYRLVKQVDADLFVVDGNLKLNLENKKIESLVKADANVAEVMAASIIAKVSRDNLMRKLHHQFPEYGWEKNVGYGTKTHVDGIKRYGSCVYHRTLFIRNSLI